MEIELTAQAEADLVEIGDFIAKDNPSAAERYIRRLRDRIEVLREFPEAGHRIRKRSNVRALCRTSRQGTCLTLGRPANPSGLVSLLFPDAGLCQQVNKLTR